MSEIIKKSIKSFFAFEPTPGQEEAMRKLDYFLNSADIKLFVLNGYAGTGKTTLIGAMVKALPAFGLKPILLAPTGRAAKVITSYSKTQALTIHKKIYKKSDEEGFGQFELKANVQPKCVFIVDEASMIGTSNDLNSRNLLEDLFAYAYGNTGCKIILIGDVAQLPPVGMYVSPALNVKYLTQEYGIKLDFFGLQEVVRQKEGSGILENATRLRLLIRQKELTPYKFNLDGFTDIIRMPGDEMEDALNDAYSKYGAEGTIFICRSNKNANLYNKQIRARIRWQENDLSAGDLLMIVKNNYFWLSEDSKAGFIANGDIVEVLKIKKTEDKFGFTFAHVTLRMLDYPDEPNIEVILNLNSLSSDTPSLTSEQNKELYQSLMMEYSHITNKRQLFKQIKEDPYFNALQVKFAYAVTCHKAQGGQWPCVFVDQGYLTKEMVNKEFMRWLYTAITRATEKVYLVNFNKDFFEEED